MPTEVASPAVAARVEERGQLFCDSVAAGDIRPLIRVAMKTAQSQVARNCRAVMLPGDDVIELERGREEGLRHQAIFAAASGTAPHQFDEPGVHENFPATLLPGRFLESSPCLGVEDAEQAPGIGEPSELG